MMIEIKMNKRSFKWKYRRAMLGHYWRMLVSPTYRALWRAVGGLELRLRK